MDGKFCEDDLSIGVSGLNVAEAKVSSSYHTREHIGVRYDMILFYTYSNLSFMYMSIGKGEM